MTRWRAAEPVLLFLVALAVRIPGFGRPEIGDESVAVVTTGLTWAGIVETLVTREAHPPLFFFLLNLWGVVSTDLAWLRMLTILVGAATCLVIYRIGVEGFGLAVGRAAFAVTAFSPLLVYISQYLRSYAPATLLAAVAVLLTLRLSRQTDARRIVRLLAALTVCEAAMLYTYYLSLFVVAAVNLFLLVHFARTSPRWIAGLAVSVIVVALAFAPWLPLYAAQTSKVHSGASGSAPMLKSAAMGFYLGPIQVGAIAKAFLALLHVDELRLNTVRLSTQFSKPVLGVLGLGGGVAILLLTVAGIRRLHRAAPGAAVLVLLVAALPVLGALTLSVVGDLGLWHRVAINIRYFAESAAVFSLVIAAGLLAARPRMVAGGLALVVAVAFAGQLAFIYRYPFNDQGKVLAFLQRHPDVPVVASFPSAVETLFDAGERERFRRRYERLVIEPAAVPGAVDVLAGRPRFYLFRITTAERLVQYPTFARDFEAAVAQRGFVKAAENQVSDVLNIAFFERAGAERRR